jgi:hypothetical protein
MLGAPDVRTSQCFDVYRLRLWRGSYCSLDGVACVRGSQTDQGDPLVNTRAKGEAPAFARPGL